MNMTTRISLWSGPRNVSTAMMYSFGQRSSCRIIDEPLYAYYLRKTGLPHPGREKVLEEMSTDLHQVINDVLLSEYEEHEVFFKNMAHHFIDVPWGLLHEFHNIFLIREPKYVIESYIKQIQSPTVSDLGYDLIYEMTEHIEKEGNRPYIIDTRDILNAPKEALTAICDEIGIPFEDNMLQWESGPRKEDGSWAKYWYKNVHRSTGFMAYEERRVYLPQRLEPLLRECQNFYELLKGKSIKLNSK